MLAGWLPWARMENTELFDKSKPAGSCAAIECTMPATHEEFAEGRHLRFANGIELPKASVSFSAKLCDSHTLYDTGMIIRPDNP
ncbi:hypothetical protein SEA_ZIRINKA_31 [Gordonia phage Zirinka]|uniref:Uncharacterized protein n=2 Tax=Nymphadoravirus zirinka TaxID=2170042 RepID=A0A1B3B267_9CAUD|nr:hypothetical protein SEA_ZIRINKA_31 [Gordonia phage Zirinka]AOE45078.1 hypothetical protein SEA_ZIRINKA_31 [Gordonia phage Zirinka]AYQ99173.1 hypothetical protein PBI_BIALOTA_31 [Gordonia phage Bialota]